ncbi:hypothetical protein [Virgibacillus salexigens]|uniref:hypothetical protein n=1 Tax=Virgibacillus salexigens TaxID=61016 RepID=UPI0030814E05
MDERLDDITPIGFDKDKNYLIKQEDYFWFQEQAERVQELEKDNKRLKDLNSNNLPVMRSMHEKTERYKQALEELNHDLFSERMEKDKYQYRSDIQKERIKELEQALEFYADEKSYTEKVNDEWGATTAILVDRGSKARNELKGVEG